MHRPSKRTRTATQTVTVGGVARDVPVPHPTPKPPPDWDRRRSTAAMAVTVAVVAGALAWSTYAIGHLLTAVAPDPLAYGVAAVYDAAWILTMAREYELRLQPDRLRGLRLFGWLLLAGSTAVVFVHGVYAAGVVVAACGAAISLFAKILWHVRVHLGRRPLDPAVQAWVDAMYSEGDAAILAATMQREINRINAKVAAELAVLGTDAPYQPGTAVPALVPVGYGQPGPVPDGAAEAGGPDPAADAPDPADVPDPTRPYPPGNPGDGSVLGALRKAEEVAAAYADKGVPLTRDALRVEMGVGNAAATTYHRHLKECGLIPG